MPATMVSTEQGIIFTFKQSKYLMLNVLNILFRSEADKTVTFYVKDTVTGDIYDTFTVDLVAGENTIPINKSYAPRRHSNKLFIGYDGSTTGYYVTSDRSCYDDCDDCGCSDVCEANGGDIVSGFSVTKTGMTYGLSVQYSLDCSFSRLLCENIGALKQAMLYAAGIEYMYEMMGTSRMNRYTMTKREDFDSIKDMFEARYKNSLKAAIKNINLCDTCCFECKGGILYNYVNP